MKISRKLIAVLVAVSLLGLTAGSSSATAKNPWLPKSKAKKLSIDDGWGYFMTYGQGDSNVTANCTRYSPSWVHCHVYVVDTFYYTVNCISGSYQPFSVDYLTDYYMDWKARWTWKKRGIWVARGHRSNIRKLQDVTTCGEVPGYAGAVVG